MPAGQWRDAIAISGPLGDRTCHHLRAATHEASGPILRDLRAIGGRHWFLVPIGTAATWREHGTEALGDGSYIGIPISLDVPALGISWASRPDALPQHVDPGLLRLALAAARNGGRL